MVLGAMCAYVLARFDFFGARAIYYLMLAGLTFPISYHFEPGAAEDGLTIDVPVAIVTRSATRGDAEASIRIHAPLSATLDALGAALDA